MQIIYFDKTYKVRNSLNITESYYICIYENLYFKTAT